MWPKKRAFAYVWSDNSAVKRHTHTCVNNLLGGTCPSRLGTCQIISYIFFSTQPPISDHFLSKWINNCRQLLLMRVLFIYWARWALGRCRSERHNTNGAIDLSLLLSPSAPWNYWVILCVTLQWENLRQLARSPAPSLMNCRQYF